MEMAVEMNANTTRQQRFETLLGGRETVRIENTEINPWDAEAFCQALVSNTTVTTLELINCALRDHGASELADAIKFNKTLTNLDLSGNKIGGTGVSEIAHALRHNKTLLVLNLSDNAVDVKGGKALARALERNKTLLELNLSSTALRSDSALILAEEFNFEEHATEIALKSNKIRTEGAIAMAEMLQSNKTLLRLRLQGNSVGNVGMLALCDAMLVNTTLVELDGRDNKFACVEVTKALQSLTKPPKHTPGTVSKASSLPALKIACRDYRRNQFFEMHWLLQRCLRKPDTSNGSYCAVAAAMLGSVENALHCLRMWPGTAHEVLRERYGTSWSASGCLKDAFLRDYAHLSPLSGTMRTASAQRRTEAVEAAVAVATALKGSNHLTTVNIHLCGEGYAGKTMTKQALQHTLSATHLQSFWLLSLLVDDPRENGRTLGMVSAPLECLGKDGTQIRVLLHDYGGQVDFRANHAPHLSSPNSIYVILVPLWDKRPGCNKPFELDQIKESYTEWVKYIYTITHKDTVPGGGSSSYSRAPHVITVVNFVRLYSNHTPRQLSVTDVTAELVRIQESFNADGNTRVHFVGAPVLLDVNTPREVYNLLAPQLKDAMYHLAASPYPVSPCLQTVLNDMALPQKWPLFSYQEDLTVKIVAAIKAKHAPTASSVPNPYFQEDVVNTISEITQNMLESRRDIVVFPVPGNQYISINRPNWLTSELLGNLFDPRRRRQAQMTLPLKAVQHDAELSHLMSAQDINSAVANTLDAQTKGMIDDQFIPKLLQHVGVCIPVVVDAEGFVAGVAEGTDASRVKHWFPAFSTVAMKETDGAVLSGADHIVARRFQLKDPEFSLFPHGYFSSLFVSIVSLYNRTNLVQIYKDGMELRSGADTFQIVVRQREEDQKSFVVTVATAASAPHCDLSFQTIQAITDFIIPCTGNNNAGWRGNVRVQEYGIHPRHLVNSGGIPIEQLQERLRSSAPNPEDLAFYFGLRSNGGGQLVPYLLEDVVNRLIRLDARVARITHYLDSFREELRRSLSSLHERLVAVQGEDAEAVQEIAERVEASLQEYSAFPVNNAQDLQTLCENLTAVMRTVQSEDFEVLDDSMHDLSSHSNSLHSRVARNSENSEVLNAVSFAWDNPLRELWTALSQADDLIATDLQTMRAEIMRDLGQLSREMRSVTQTVSHAMQSAEAQAEQAHLEQTASTEELQQQVALLHQQLAESASTISQLHAQIQRVDSGVLSVRNVQQDVAYGVYASPLLYCLVEAPAKGLRGTLARTIFEVYRLHFICPCCGKKAASGPKGNGYKLNVTKTTVERMAKVLRCTLVALQVLSLLTPVPLPHLADLAQYLPGDNNSGAIDNAVAVARDLADSSAAINRILSSIESTVVSPTSVAATAQHSQAANDPSTAASGPPADATQRPIITDEHVQSVREVLQMVGEDVSPSCHPKYTGLTRATCRSKGQSAWVCRGEGEGTGPEHTFSACKNRYMAEGNDCLAVKIIFA